MAANTLTATGMHASNADSTNSGQRNSDSNGFQLLLRTLSGKTAVHSTRVDDVVRTAKQWSSFCEKHRKTVDDVRGADSVQCLKERIAASEGVRPEDQRLIGCGIQL